MALLEGEDGEQCVLWADHLVGRAPESGLRLEHDAVSWRHASIRWTGRVWEVQDLGSRNGTLVDDKPLEPGARAVLRVGTKLTFGTGGSDWLVVDADPPETMAVAVDDGSRVPEQAGLIALPDAERPDVTIYRAPDGEWVAESEERIWQPEREEIVLAGGRAFRFVPGGAVHATSGSNSLTLTPEGIGLDFVVSRNEEQVDITIQHGAAQIPLRARAHGYLLLTLARLRLEDQDNDGGLPTSSHGWVAQERLLKMLATNRSQLALDIYRARRQFGDAGLHEPARIVERRAGSRELRIGIAKLAVRVA